MLPRLAHGAPGHQERFVGVPLRCLGTYDAISRSRDARIFYISVK
jgi:hypothetical protein